MYDTISEIALILGPGFRLPIDDKMNLYYGIGISLMQLAGMYENTTSYYSILSYNLGIGGNVGLKYDFSDALYFDVGVIAHYDFKNYTIISSTYINGSSWNDNYMMVSFRPYVAMGFNFYRESTGFGKPKG